MSKPAAMVSAPSFALRGKSLDYIMASFNDLIVGIENANNHTLTVFIAVQLTGGLANLLLLLTAALSKRIHRETTWLSSCVCWIVFAFSYSLL